MRVCVCRERALGLSVVSWWVHEIFDAPRATGPRGGQAPAHQEMSPNRREALRAARAARGTQIARRQENFLQGGPGAQGDCGTRRASSPRSTASSSTVRRRARDAWERSPSWGATRATVRQALLRLVAQELKKDDGTRAPRGGGLSLTGPRGGDRQGRGRWQRAAAAVAPAEGMPKFVPRVGTERTRRVVRAQGEG